MQRRFLNGKSQDQAAPQELPNSFKESKPGPNVLLKRELHNTGRHPNPPCMNAPLNMLKMVMNYKYLGIACCMSIVCFGKYYLWNTPLVASILSHYAYVQARRKHGLTIIYMNYYYYFDVFVLLANVKITMNSKQHNNGRIIYF